MKILLAAASAIALTATGAWAQNLSANDAEFVRTLVPGADLTTLTPAQAEALTAAVSAGDVLRDPAAPERIRMILANSQPDVRRAMLTESEIEELRHAAPGADPNLLTAEQAIALSTHFSAPDYMRGADASAFVAGVLSGEMAGAGKTANLSEIDAERVRRLVPDADLRMLRADQARALSDFVNSDDYRQNRAATDFVTSILAG